MSLWYWRDRKVTFIYCKHCGKPEHGSIACADAPWFSVSDIEPRTMEDGRVVWVKVDHVKQK